jgi:hypothetical protein
VHVWLRAHIQPPALLHSLRCLVLPLLQMTLYILDTAITTSPKLQFVAGGGFFVPYDSLTELLASESQV